MGCDIHLAVEQKNTYANDKERQAQEALGLTTWVMVGTEYDITDPDEVTSITQHMLAGDRNYERFSALAGVRGDGPNALGEPKDPSPGTRAQIDGWDSDGHSHSHLPIMEFINICETTHWIPDGESARDIRNATFPELYEYWFGTTPKKDDPSLYRVVFWFDN